MLLNQTHFVSESGKNKKASRCGSSEDLSVDTTISSVEEYHQASTGLYNDIREWVTL